jgi:hypothetical protein
MFASIYANADPDTRRAMIKSYTESGGTTLSTDWSSIGKGELIWDTVHQPPDRLLREDAGAAAGGHVRDQVVRGLIVASGRDASLVSLHHRLHTFMH